MTDTSPASLRQRLSEASFALPAEDLLHSMLPLMREVAALHQSGLVADLGDEAIVDNGDGRLALARPEGRAPELNERRIRAIQPHGATALRIVGEYRVTTDIEAGSQVEDLLTAGAASKEDGEEREVKPVYLTGYRCWEQQAGHHDEQTDIFLIGLVLASLACGLDFNDETDVRRFSAEKANLFRLNRHLHPVIASLIGEMTALNRHERATDLAAAAKRLEEYREQPAGLDVERVLAETKGVPSRRAAVLTHLRDRLFDLSRRNRLIHFRPTQASVNLTVASVPMVIRLESIRPEQLCTWDGRFANEVLSGSKVALAKWLRFEDQVYLPSAFDRIIQETRRNRAEYGFSHLRLVVAFLHWHNLKDSPDERIHSPFLWLPVEVVKQKGVRDQYYLRATEGEAEFNPALRHFLRQLYDIRLPETVDLTQTSIEEIQADLAGQIRRSEPGVKLDLNTRPEIELIHQKAVHRLRSFQRRKDVRARTQGVQRPDYSYELDDYRPLGLALFEKYVKPSPLPQRIAVGAPMPPRPDRMAATGEAEAMSYALAGGEGHRFSWEIDLTQVTLANFNYKKMSLVRDYNQLIEERITPPSFDTIFSIEPRALEEKPPAPLAPSELWSVVPADATQEAAVSLSRTGRSFIIQGPPGTGKSQTITNLIADYAAQGRRVLFVCEKRAALDVVFSRLKLAGLDRLACLIHDSQEDKKAFVLDLKDCYERWSKADDAVDRQRATRAATIEALTRHLSRIDAFDRAMSSLPEESTSSLRAMIRRLFALPDPGDAGPATHELLPSPASWDSNRTLADRIHRIVSDMFGLDSLAEHAFARLSAATVAAERSYASVEQMLDEAEKQFDRLDSALEDESVLLSRDQSLADSLELVRAASEAVATNLAGNLELLDHGSAAFADFRTARSDRDLARQRHEAAAEAARHWNDRLTPEDTEAALEQARRQEPSFFKFLSGSWRRLKATIRSRYDFSAHAAEPSITSVLERLAALHSAAAEDEAARKEINRRFGTEDADGLAALADRWSSDPPPLVRRLLAHVGNAPDPAEAMAREARPAQPIEALADLCARHLDDSEQLTLEALAEAIRDMREGMDDLPDLIPLLRSVDQAGPGIAFALRRLPLDPARIEALVLDEAIARALRAEPSLQRFDAAELAASARRAARARTLLQDDNAACIRAGGQRRFRENIRRSTLSVTQLDGAGREFKKAYATGRRELEHEFGKTMRYRSIRDLADDETGIVVNDLKPIWLMSPLSVSDTLPLQDGLFDVVIFDEASQIPTEEAVPALSRAPQVIVVGDEMQLPPTSFFAAARDEDEMQVTAEEDGERMAILLDADSLLNQAARSLPATMLAWHYRSRSEALISFSNAAFYDGRLVTIPDRTIAEPSASPEPVRSDDPASAALATDRMLARAISFLPVADGLYEKRGNLPEARLIAAMVRDLLARETGLSIGIVAFSEAQQTEIENALDSLAAGDPDFAARLESEYIREDDGQVNGLFVKNLENVQGDERDVILLSICYAPDRDGRMAMNFGPINQRGGEKRLNVIFSRARHHMAVVSTIRAEAITNTHNDGARALRTFLAFAEAQARGDGSHSQTILATLNPEAERVFARAPAADPLRESLAAALRERGHVVREHVGSASFRCDLTIVSPDGGSHQLAILLDGDSGDSVGDRYVFQPTVLRNFGWTVVDVPSHSWLRNPKTVIAQIEAALRGDGSQEIDDDPFEDGGAVAQPSVPRTRASEEPPEQEPRDMEGESGGFTEFQFQRGTSDKFWRIAVSGNDVIVVFGRNGTKGSTVTKTYETPERARREANKLTLEKLHKGYVEVGAPPQ